ncbi:MAG: GNAT family N-acetyltransferase [Bacteroidia bacterium]|nr:GNAT family N-acetyltransferase [Bacteroidia bacterium]
MIKVEKATLKHLDDLSVLFDQYRIFYQKVSDITSAKIFLKDRMEKNESVIFVSFNNENIMTGFTQLYPLFSSTRMKRVWLLNDLFVENNYRGQGFSIALIEKAKEHCRKTGGFGLTLETEKSNEIGNNLYPRAGFVLDREHNFYSWKA